jgi:Lhr-like helicase
MAFDSKMNLQELQKKQRKMSGDFTRASASISKLNLDQPVADQIISLLDEQYKKQLTALTPSLQIVAKEAKAAEEEKVVEPSQEGAQAPEANAFV